LDTILVPADGPPLPHALAAELSTAHGSRLRCVRDDTVTTAAAAIGAGLIVTGDVRAAAHIARVAPCSVLVTRAELGGS
jgi:hypothetical protein